MSLLVLADVHANLTALEAVLRDARGLYEQVVFCGDAVGYGPDPTEVIGILADLPLLAAVRGNHDRAALGGNALDFSEPARAAVTWTAARLGPDERQWLESLPPGPVEVSPGLVACHGHPDDEDLYLLGRPLVESALQALPGGLSLHGHTHLPAAWWEDPDEPDGLAGSLAGPGAWTVEPGRAATLNPGSVGQPRDGDPRAAYLLLDPASREAVWRRVAYDAEQVLRRVLDADLPAWLGERLLEGR
jgi:diadenosine tetraphosphatase ApaH/serine/threonine PP2A family protein phosphatase